MKQYLNRSIKFRNMNLNVYIDISILVLVDEPKIDG